MLVVDIVVANVAAFRRWRHDCSEATSALWSCNGELTWLLKLD